MNKILADNKARWTRWGPIVYSSVSDEDADHAIIRLSLHPEIDSKPCSHGPKLGHRAVWDFFVSDDDDFYTSCRSPDVKYTEVIGQGGIDEAIAWLIEDEVTP